MHEAPAAPLLCLLLVWMFFPVPANDCCCGALRKLIIRLPPSCRAAKHMKIVATLPAWPALPRGNTPGSLQDERCGRTYCCSVTYWDCYAWLMSRTVNDPFRTSFGLQSQFWATVKKIYREEGRQNLYFGTPTKYLYFVASDSLEQAVFLVVVGTSSS